MSEQQEVCTHELKRKEMVFYSCDCFYVRYYPSESVENLILYYKWERGMTRRQALNYIINLYTEIGNNKPLIENARHKLLGLDKEDD